METEAKFERGTDCNQGAAIVRVTIIGSRAAACPQTCRQQAAI
jgi:hypothetical protein